MPGRQSTSRRHAPVPNSTSSKSRSGPRKQKKRAQNALSIAEHAITDNPRLKRSRFGDIDQGFRKRQRDDDNHADSEDDDAASDEDGGRGGAKRVKWSDLRERYGKDADYGSDSEGNEWVTGQVDEEDDDSVDSDEAFGESDEDRFEGFTFRGSKKGRKGRKAPKKAKADAGILDEDGEEVDDEELDSGEESDNFRENAVDLATMLDDNLDDDSSEDEEQGNKSKTEKRTNQDDSEDEESMSDASLSGSESASDISDKSSLFPAEEDDDPRQSDLLKDLVAGFPTGDTTQSRSDAARIRAQEAMDPSTAPAATDSSTLDLLSSLDPSLRALMGANITAPKRGAKGIPGVVDAPLAQRQQGRLDRAAAFEKSKETLSRWVDTVKHNRRAEHLVFPLHSVDEASAKNTDRLQPVTNGKPFSSLEATIQNILAESGMAATSAQALKQDGGEDALALEGAGDKQLTLAEVKARNAELRRARELLFREEVKAKRIKKIKSKSYRRVHRKERERNLEQQRELDAEDGVGPEEDERDRLDRLRAEERMGAKHREGKWAKAVKAGGRAQWDEDARAGVIDMARREEELKRRIHGLATGKDADGSAGEESDADDDLDDEEADGRLRDELFRLREEDEPAKGKGSKLASMKFMQKAEAARKEENEAALAELQRELDGKGSEDEEDSDDAEKGRRRFGPANELNIAIPARKENRNEFEERDDSDAEDTIPRRGDVEDDADDDAQAPATTNGTSRKGTRHQPHQTQRTQPRNRGLLGQEKPKATTAAAEADATENAYFSMAAAPRRNSKKTAAALADQAVHLDPEDNKPTLPAPAQRPGKENAPSKALLKRPVRLLASRDGDDDTSSSGGSGDETSSANPQRKLIQEAFAGDETGVDFEEEKRAVAREERSPSPAADILPGWGSWTGSGLNKRDKKERKQRTDRQQKQAKDAFAASKGGKHVNQTRKDANLHGVIISEKKMPKSAKYLATAIPYPFESRAQYERSLRMPLNPESTTKETHQASTKPRVITAGSIIKPMEKPLF